MARFRALTLIIASLSITIQGQDNLDRTVASGTRPNSHPAQRDPYLRKEVLPQRNITIKSIHQLHTAYRNPLQRLSDDQLTMLLRRNTAPGIVADDNRAHAVLQDGENAGRQSRREMIKKLRKLISQSATRTTMSPIPDERPSPPSPLSSHRRVLRPKSGRRPSSRHSTTTTTTTESPKPLEPELPSFGPAGRGIVPYKLPDPGLTASGTRPAQTDSIILDEVSLGSGSPNVTHVPIWRPRVFETTTANPALSNNSLAASAVVAALAAPSVKVPRAIRRHEKSIGEEEDKEVYNYLQDLAVHLEEMEQKIEKVRSHYKRRRDRLLQRFTHHDGDKKKKKEEVIVLPQRTNKAHLLDSDLLMERPNIDKAQLMRRLRVEALAKRRLSAYQKGQQQGQQQQQQEDQQQQQDQQNQSVTVVSKKTKKQQQKAAKTLITSFSITPSTKTRLHSSKLVLKPLGDDRDELAEFDVHVPVKHLDRMKLIDSDGDGDGQSTKKPGLVEGDEQSTQKPGVVDGEAHNSRPIKVKHRKKNNRKQTQTQAQAQTQVTAAVPSTEAKLVEGGEEEKPITEPIITTTPVYGNDTNIDEQVKVQPSSKNDANAACDLVTCSFEDGTLCRYVSSKEEVPFGSRQYLRVRREKHNESSSSSNIVHRAWHNWIGRFRNRLTGIARAQVFGEENQRFAAAYVRSKQRATLTARVLFDDEQTVRFRSWEATRGVTLSMCCDHNCLWKTEIGVKRGSRYWIDREVTCPAGTQKIMFVCENVGKHQGACGLDNIHLTNGICPLLLPAKGLVDGGGGDGNRKRRI